MNYPKIAIRGNLKEGKDILNFFKKFGVDCTDYHGKNNDCFYYIDEKGRIEHNILKDVPSGYKLLETVPQTEKIYELWI